MKTYNKKETLEILSDKEKLFNLLKEENGFFLTIIKKHEINPDIDLLIESNDLNVYRFLLDNYKVSAAQKKKIMNSELFFEIKEHAYKQAESFDVLLNRKPIEKKLYPKLNTEELFKITNAYALLSEQDRKYYNEDGVYNVFYNSLKSLSEEDFLKISPEFKKDFNNLYFANSSFLKNSEIKNEFFSFFDKSQMNWSMLKSFSIKPEDQEWVKSFISQRNDRYSSITYGELKNIEGFLDVIDENFLIENLTINMCNSFSKSKFLKNKDLFEDCIIQKLLLDKYNKEDLTYKAFVRFEEFKFLGIDENKFEYVFNEKFLNKFFTKAESLNVDIHAGYIHSDESDKGLELQKNIRLAFLDYMGQSINSYPREYIEFYAIKESISTVVDSLGKFDFNSKWEILDEFLEKNNVIALNALDIINEKHIDNFVDSKLILYGYQNKEIFDSEENFKKIINPNAFFVLLGMMSNREEKNQIFTELNFKTYDGNEEKFRFYEDLFIKITNNLIENKDNKNLKALYVILNYFNEQKSSKSLKEILEIIEPYKKQFIEENIGNTDSFFNYEKNTTFIDRTNGLFSLLWDFDSNFKYVCLEKNKEIPYSFFMSYINKDDLSDDESKFLNSWVNKNEEFLNSKDGEKYLHGLLRCKNFNNLDIKFLSNNDENNFNNLIQLMQASSILSPKHLDIDIMKLREQDNKFSKMDGKSALLEFDKIKGVLDIDYNTLTDDVKVDIYYLKNRIKSIQYGSISDISLGFLKNKVNEFLTNQNYDLVTQIIESSNNTVRDDLSSVVASHLKTLDYVDVNRNIDDSKFIDLMHVIFKSRIDNKHILKFKDFGLDNNKKIFIKLVDIFDSINPYKDENIYGFKNVPYFFEKSAIEFLKKYMIENEPQYLLGELKYDTNYAYKKEGRLISNYSNYDISEFVDLSNNLFNKNKRDYLSLSKSLVDILSDIVDGNQKFEKDEQKKLEKFNQYLSIVNNFKISPVQYFSLLNPNIVWNLTKGVYDINLKDEERFNLFINKNIDEKQFISGYKESLDVYIDNIKGIKGLDFNLKKKEREKLSVICDNLSNMYYSITYGERKGLDNSNWIKPYIQDEVNNMFFDKAPMFLMGNDVYFKSALEKTKESVDIDVFKKFFYVDGDLIDKYFNINNEESNQKLKRVIESIITSATEKKDKDLLSYISYQVESFRFIKKELSEDKMYDYVNQSETYKNVDLDIVSFVSEDKDILNLLRKSMLLIDLDEKVVKKSVQDDHINQIRRAKI